MKVIDKKILVKVINTDSFSSLKEKTGNGFNYAAGGNTIGGHFIAEVLDVAEDLEANVKIGDQILIRTNAGTEVMNPKTGERERVLPPNEVLAVLEDNEKVTVVD